MNDQYMKMCGQSKEVQGSWKPKEGDLRFARGGYGSITPKRIPSDIKEYYAWLPRIEDLLVLVEENLKVTMSDAYSSYWFTRAFLESVAIKASADQYQYAETTTEFILCYIMDRHYNKSWDGESWIVK